MAANPERNVARSVVMALLAVAAFVLLWVFPPFRIVSLQGQVMPAAGPGGSVVFDPVAAAAKLWQKDLPAAAGQASDLGLVLAALQADPVAARKKFARASGLGTAYYFVRGRGRVISRDRGYLRIAVAGDMAIVVNLRIGPVFGNTVRDGCALLDVNSFPGLTEFNALAAELNALVERNVIPALREKAAVGAEVEFAGCAEAPDGSVTPGEPRLNLVPVQAEVRP